MASQSPHSCAANRSTHVLRAGRENFLAAEADAALFKMVATVSDARGISALLACAGHKSNFVRQKTAAHLDSALEAAGTRSGLLPCDCGVWTTVDP
jgi:hypothetical protein